METIVKYYNYLILERFKESDNFYILFDSDLVHVDDIQTWGDEIRVEYTKEDGTKHTYIADTRDFKEDFIETDKTFGVDVKTKDEIYLNVKKEQKYNIVFYMGTTKMETIKSNVDSKQAYSLKNYFSKDPKYKMGKIVVEKI